jgi:hypothetical protein
MRTQYHRLTILSVKKITQSRAQGCGLVKLTKVHNMDVPAHNAAVLVEAVTICRLHPPHSIRLPVDIHADEHVLAGHLLILNYV